MRFPLLRVRRFSHVLPLAAVLMICCSASAQPLPRSEWGAPQVTVSEAQGKWTIAGQKQTVVLNAADLALEVRAGPATWAMVPSSAGDLLVKTQGAEFPLRLADAGKIVVVPYDTGFKTGVKLTLSDWRRGGRESKEAPLDLKLYLTLALEGSDEDLVFGLTATENAAVVRRLDWPAALDAREVDHTLLSNVRGVLLPRNWPTAYNPIRGDDKYPNDTSEIQSNIIESWSMSWWGFQKGKSAMMVIVETPDDAAYQFSHPAGGPTVIGPRWRTALGKLGYPRAGRMCFVPEGNYVDLAKRYRRHAMDTGLFVSLQEKIARRPIVKELIGTPIIRSSILTEMLPGSYRYNLNLTKDPSRNNRLTTFDERGQQYRRFKEQGLDRLCVVLTGWPQHGYDRQHPDELPPAPAAGGWEGMKRLAETCRELGYLFSLHDQYRDYYLDAPSYDPQFAVHEETDEKTPSEAFPGTRFGQKKIGAIPVLDYWDGGEQAYLNSRFMLGHIQKNYLGLFARGIKPQGIYLDVFGYVPPDEDFRPEHPTTRTESIRDHANCYIWSRNNIGFIGTEAACDWTVPYSDFSSPLAIEKGVRVPLFNLVYHDAIITPYEPGDLHGLLNGGGPQMFGATELAPETIALIKRMSALHQRVALLELTKHEFLDAHYRKERSTFADGTTVTVDWDAKTVEILPELK